MKRRSVKKLYFPLIEGLQMFNKTVIVEVLILRFDCERHNMALYFLWKRSQSVGLLQLLVAAALRDDTPPNKIFVRHLVRRRPSASTGRIFSKTH